MEEKVLLDVQIRAQEALQSYQLLQQRITELRTEQKALADAGQENTAIYRANEQAIKALTKRSQEYTKEIQNNIKVEHNAQAQRKGSMQDLKAQLSLATAAFNNLSKAEREADLQAGRMGNTKSLSFQIKQMTTELNAAEQELLNFRRNVGNYPSAFNALGTSLQGMGAKVGQSLTMMFGPFALVMGAITGAISAVKNGLSTITEFSSASSNLAAILGTTKSEITELTENAKELGATTQYTATQITELQTELAKLGFTKQEILDATGAVQNFATATGSDLAEAAALCGSALRAFGLEATEMDRVASVLAVSTTKSALSFDKLNTSFSIVSPVAKAFGFSIEDTTALLGTLANSGFDASSMATALRNLFLNLADANGKLAKKLGEPIKSLDDLAPAFAKLKAQGIDLGDALELTDKRSVAAFETLIEGSTSVQDLRDSITDCNEALDDMSKEKLDNLEGDTTLMKSAWDGLMLSFGGTEGILRPVVQWLTQVINKIQSAWERIRDFFSDLYKNSAGFRALMQVFATTFRQMASGISETWHLLMSELKAGGKLIQGIFTLDWDLVKQAFKEGATAQLNYAKGVILGGKDNIKKAYDEVFNYEPPKIEVAEPETILPKPEIEITEEEDEEEDKKKAAEAEKARKKAEQERAKAQREAEKAQREWEQLLRTMDGLLAKSDTERARVVESKYDQAIAKAKQAMAQLGDTDEDKKKLQELQYYTLALEQEKQEQLIKVAREGAQKRVKDAEELIKSEGVVALAEFTTTEREKNNIMAEQSKKRIAIYQDELAKTNDPKLIAELQQKVATEEANIRAKNLANIKLNATEELANHLLTASEKYRIKQEYLDKELEAVRGNADEERRINEELLQARQEYLNELGNSVSEWGGQLTSIMSSLSSALQNIGTNELNKYKKDNDKKKDLLKKRLQQGLISESTYNKQVEALDQERADKENAIKLKQAKWQKAMAIMNATLGAAQAIIMSLAQSPVAYGPAPNPMGIASLALATAMGIAQIAVAASTPLPTAGRGMLIEGASHADGGVLINAEGGEAIINKAATKRYLPLLSRINQSTGGVPLYGTGGIAGTIQGVQSAVEAGIDYDALASACANIPVYAAITDINRGQQRVAMITDRKRY